MTRNHEREKKTARSQWQMGDQLEKGLLCRLEELGPSGEHGRMSVCSEHSTYTMKEGSGVFGHLTQFRVTLERSLSNELSALDRLWASLWGIFSVGSIEWEDEPWVWTSSLQWLGPGLYEKCTEHCMYASITSHCGHNQTHSLKAPVTSMSLPWWTRAKNCPLNKLLLY